MRSMRIDVAKFAKDHHEAATAGLTVKEFADLLGISVVSLNARWRQCRKRGIRLPLLKDQQERLARGIAAWQRREARQNRKAEREARRKIRKDARHPAPSVASSTAVNIDALSEQVADKVYARLRDTLRFQFFVGPEVPA